jgi:putative transposase
VLRDFTAALPNQLWLTDITEHPTAEAKIYLCAVKDACSKRVVG